MFRIVPLLPVLALVALWLPASAAYAGETLGAEGMPLERLLRGLPELPAALDGPGHFAWDGDSASVGYATRKEEWRATLNGDEGFGRTLDLRYGTLLSETLGTGIRLTRAGEYSEVLLKGVFAPEKDVRIHLAGSQLRNVDGDAVAPGIRPDSVWQNSIVAGLRRHFGEDRPLTDLGLAAYAVEARGRLAPDFGKHDVSSGPAATAHGRMDGYLLEFGLRPTAASRIEYRRELGHLRYGLGAALRSEERIASSRIGYSRRFDNCLLLATGYSADAYSGRMDIGLARNNWNLAIDRAVDGADTSVQIAYSIPLGSRGGSKANCGVAPGKAAPLSPMIDAVTSRPAQIPYGPLLTTDLAE